MGPLGGTGCGGTPGRAERPPSIVCAPGPSCRFFTPSGVRSFTGEGKRQFSLRRFSLAAFIKAPGGGKLQQETLI